MTIGTEINTKGVHGFVYEISPSGKTVRLQDKYGNKELKWFNLERDLGISAE